MTTSTSTVKIDGIGPVPVTFAELGEGQPFLLLHGGAGPQSVAGFAGLLAGTGSARVITPTHPGFSATPRPDGFDSMADLARLYSGLIDDLGLTGVAVIGNSVGGWIAAEIALLNNPRISGVVLVDAAGLQVAAAPAADFFSLTMDQVADLSYYNPDAFRIDVDRLPDQQKAVMAGNRASLAIYGGTAMADPSLLGRLSAVTTPVLVVWGAADRMIPPEHGRAYASAIPGARFELIPDAGHLPQLETPDTLLKAVLDFTGAVPSSPSSPTGPTSGNEAS
jgi:pimeloyl-ACP methyl ester carboxylesterase